MEYRSIITNIGKFVSELLEDKMIVMYNENTPADLAEVSVLHTISNMENDVKSGDIIILGGNDYTVTAIGETANDTLKKLGHCTFCFNGKDEVSLPGQIELLGEELPNIQVGEPFEIIFV